MTEDEVRRLRSEKVPVAQIALTLKLTEREVRSILYRASRERADVNSQLRKATTYQYWEYGRGDGEGLLEYADRILTKRGKLGLVKPIPMARVALARAELSEMGLPTDGLDVKR